MRMSVLMALILMTALGVVYNKYRSRMLFNDIHRLEKRIRQAEVQHDNLVLEYVTWSDRNQIEKIAQDELFMHYPTSAEIVYLSTNGR